jgi:hypothetical protein
MVDCGEVPSTLRLADLDQSRGSQIELQVFVGKIWLFRLKRP